MQTIPIAPGVTQLVLAPRQALNAYLIGSVLVDAGIRASAPGLLEALTGQPLRAHVLTHAHPDHQGASAAICAARGVPLWCGAVEREAAESGLVTRAYPNPTNLIAWLRERDANITLLLVNWPVCLAGLDTIDREQWDAYSAHFS